MATVSERSRKLVDDVLAATVANGLGSDEDRAEAAELIEQALLAERRLAMEIAISIVDSERVGDSTEPDRAYNMALEHACHSLRHAVATPRGGE